MHAPDHSGRELTEVETWARDVLSPRSPPGSAAPRVTLVRSRDDSARSSLACPSEQRSRETLVAFAYLYKQEPLGEFTWNGAPAEPDLK
ncbi:hypothetical protein GCM10010360_12740 [Streptomyces nogalater]